MKFVWIQITVGRPRWDNIDRGGLILQKKSGAYAARTQDRFGERARTSSSARMDLVARPGSCPRAPERAHPHVPSKFTAVILLQAGWNAPLFAFKPLGDRDLLNS